MNRMKIILSHVHNLYSNSSLASTGDPHALAQSIRLRANAFTLGALAKAMGTTEKSGGSHSAAQETFSEFDRRLAAFRSATDCMAVEDVMMMVVDPTRAA